MPRSRGATSVGVLFERRRRPLRAPAPAVRDHPRPLVQDLHRRDCGAHLHLRAHHRVRHAVRPVIVHHVVRRESTRSTLRRGGAPARVRRAPPGLDAGMPREALDARWEGRISRHGPGARRGDRNLPAGTLHRRPRSRRAPSDGRHSRRGAKPCGESEAASIKVRGWDLSKTLGLLAAHLAQRHGHGPADGLVGHPSERREDGPSARGRDGGDGDALPLAELAPGVETAR